MSKRTQIPSYRLHKQSGQAVVTLTDGLGRRRDVLLGKHGTPESRAEYLRVTTEWETNGRRLPQATGPTASDLSIHELILAHWEWAVAYHGWGKRGGGCLKDALRVVKEVYGHTAAKEYGPLALKACRQRMIVQGWSRTYINRQVNRVQHMFKWATGEELVPASIYVNLRTVEGLERGKTKARETKKIKPVSTEQVNAALPHLRSVIRAMVNFQLLTGCRPGEVCLIRPLDIDMRNPACWIYRPGSDQGPHGAHKTAHHEQDRLILIGPMAQLHDAFARGGWRGDWVPQADPAGAG
jgi:hypothetical protein